MLPISDKFLCSNQRKINDGLIDLNESQRIVMKSSGMGRCLRKTVEISRHITFDACRSNTQKRTNISRLLSNSRLAVIFLSVCVQLCLTKRDSHNSSCPINIKSMTIAAKFANSMSYDRRRNNRAL